MRFRSWIKPLFAVAVVLLAIPFLFSFYLKVQDAKHPSFDEEFPITVDPVKKTIVESELVNAYFESQEFNTQALSLLSFGKWEDLFSRLAISITEVVGKSNFALVSGERFITIHPGLRKEEVANAFATSLGWGEKEKKIFLTPSEGEGLPLAEGSFSPGVYVVGSRATPEEVQAVVNQRFINNVLSRYSTSTQEILPLHTALTIASLIQRETIGTDDMRLVSGIIWNRIFADMNLQLDASLQYARTKSNKRGPWWPKVSPQDKYIRSPYNTYRNKGLPPTPIANPSVAAILAALNPEKTDCMFYFHNKKGDIYCSVTYSEHVALLKQHYGRGR